MRQNGVRSNVRFPYSTGMKKGGSAKKQGYDDKLDESLGARRGKNHKALKTEETNLKVLKKQLAKERTLLFQQWINNYDWNRNCIKRLRTFR